MTDDDANFLEELTIEELKQEYQERKEALLSESKKESTQQHDIIYENKSKGIKEDKYHRMILNAAIFPFRQEGLLPPNLDHVYVRSSPLAELRVKNVDFLIVSPSKNIAIFGEVKSSANDPSEIVRQTRERKGVIESNMDYIKQHYVQNIIRVEYVLVVHSHDALKVSNAILKADEAIILWHVGGIDLDLQRLSLFLPRVSPATRTKIVHVDERFNQALSNIRTSMEFRTFFPESHPVAKMKLLTAIDKGRDNDTFILDDVIYFVKREYDNVPDEEIKKESMDILRLAENIGFVRQMDERNYKIQSRHKKSESREADLQEKWIEDSIRKDKEGETHEKIQKLQEEMRVKKRTSYRTLEDFSDKSNTNSFKI